MTSAPAKKSAPTKTTAPKAAKPAKAEKATPKPAVISSEPLAEGQGSSPLKLKDLVARVAETTGAKKPQVKEIIEAALAEIGLALDKGEMLNLPPFGRLKVNRSKALGEGTLLSMKLKRGVTGKGGKNTAAEGLAEDGEDS